jgi:hypothetical protein
MRASYWIVVVLELFPTMAGAQVENPFIEFARISFERERSAGFAQGFQPLHDNHIGVLLPRERDSLSLQLQGGWEYLAVGICDDDCRDLYFYLHDAQGKQLGVDVWSNRRPHLRVKVAETGDYTLVTAMGSCNVPPCYFGVQWYRKPIAP